MLYLCIVVLSVFAIIEYIYICRLRKAIRYAIQTLLKYEAALTADNMFMEQIKKGMDNGFKKD